MEVQGRFDNGVKSSYLPRTDVCNSKWLIQKNFMFITASLHGQHVAQAVLLVVTCVFRASLKRWRPSLAKPSLSMLRASRIGRGSAKSASICCVITPRIYASPSGWSGPCINVIHLPDCWPVSVCCVTCVNSIGSRFTLQATNPCCGVWLAGVAP